VVSDIQDIAAIGIFFLQLSAFLRVAPNFFRVYVCLI
jgi:hypothetical protein